MTTFNMNHLRVATGLLALFALTACGEEQLPEKETIRPVKAIKVADTTEFRQRSFPGRAKATKEVELSFRVSGPLITRPVNVGDEMKQGDEIARIDPRDFENKVRTVQGQLADVQAAARRAKGDYDRLQNIFQEDPGATSQAAIDKAREQWDRAKANISSLNASVASAKDQLSYTYLKAPFEGTVVQTYVENFEDVRSKQPVVRLVDTSRIEMVVNIPENLISLVPRVTNIEVTFDPFPDRPISAQIKEIGKEASETTRTYPVTLIMDQPPDIKILPGMAGKATGEPPDELKTAAGTLEIPVASTFSGKESAASFVWVIDEASKTVKKREVKTGELADRGIRIVDGLSPGEMIVTAGVHYLREGQQVRLLEETTE